MNYEKLQAMSDKELLELEAQKAETEVQTARDIREELRHREVMRMMVAANTFLGAIAKYAIKRWELDERGSGMLGPPPKING